MVGDSDRASFSSLPSSFEMEHKCGMVEAKSKVR